MKQIPLKVTDLATSNLAGKKFTVRIVLRHLSAHTRADERRVRPEKWVVVLEVPELNSICALHLASTDKKQQERYYRQALKDYGAESDGSDNERNGS